MKINSYIIPVPIEITHYVRTYLFMDKALTV